MCRHIYSKEVSIRNDSPFPSMTQLFIARLSDYIEEHPNKVFLYKNIHAELNLLVYSLLSLMSLMLLYFK